MTSLPRVLVYLKTQYHMESVLVFCTVFML